MSQCLVIWGFEVEFSLTEVLMCDRTAESVKVFHEQVELVE